MTLALPADAPALLAILIPMPTVQLDLEHRREEQGIAQTASNMVERSERQKRGATSPMPTIELLAKARARDKPESLDLVTPLGAASAAEGGYYGPDGFGGRRIQILERTAHL